MTVNWLDLVFALILVWAVRSSWEAGLIQETFTLLGLAAGIIMAGQLYAPLARGLFGPVPEEAANAVAFLAILVGVWFGISFLGRLVRETAHWVMLGWLDKAGGVLFGVLKGVIVIEILMLVFIRFPVVNTEELIQGSLIANWIARYNPLPFIISLLPPEFRRLTSILR